MHATVAAHVGHDLARRPHLRGGELERQRALERARQLALVDEGDAAARLASDGLGAPVQEMHEEQLLEREPCSTRLRLGDGRRAVHHPERIA